MCSVNVLMATCGVRWFPICKFWIDRVDFVDKLYVKYYSHDEAFRIVKDFFSRHDEYTHLLIYAEDVVTSPDMVRLLISDAEQYDFPVVSGWCNYDFRRNWVSVNTVDLRNKYVSFADDYKFMSPIDMLFYDDDPFFECFFNGMALTLIRRDVALKVSFKPYKYVNDYVLGVYRRRGTMFDLQFAIELRNLGVKSIVDKRVVCMHFGDTTKFINLRDKKPTVEFIKKK